MTSSPVTASDILALARRTLEIEAAAVSALQSRLDDSLVRAVDILLACKGRVVVTGMGKSGHVGNKIASTLASTGTPAFFMHPAEASHGDLGMITSQDVVLALSNSGESPEILAIVPLIKRRGARLIAMTGRPGSTMAREADIHLDAAVAQEACPHNLAPTASTTAALALGDALAVVTLYARGFTAEDFARTHPGGALGRRLLIHVRDVMHKDESLPVVQEDTPFKAALMEMTRKKLGMTAVVDAAGSLVGVFTDGDLRRCLDRDLDIKTTRIDAVMTRAPKTISEDVLAAEAARYMEDKQINGLLAVDGAGRLTGAFNMHDLLRAGVV
ncbi:MAG: D-arabinose 5-phosphate isomerase [Hydrogenophilales bacterium CG03_land_8_20_14_0_80_62_28]|nr:KpsF/GutQ family sugar-phosphate isomerase [Betaproteobacteria bacterium]OIO76956.1 MAG: D-arabinose 5-phosphate isomerase [Hydrogenophilaceae bacterium CG1_02_62_390]PIV21597.1 MAG: D-arabinose 5-phosphate isomerase [Hydrogenophilales bacterium CG03_land_8_20_14_0_80_62_28]PIW39774.1 MAG: D-arabinose 5-phosphate isomerase [Hydrogenophilales bacterium CG15_BIG_FIL_POST_REV_8_21_14_020_62_31]PIW72114.1 MAG: D-arabinose 5-phosphate isomerase [Hydrogenophilales bacterium CG12_big_fil_rev_8_21_1